MPSNKTNPITGHDAGCACCSGTRFDDVSRDVQVGDLATLAYGLGSYSDTSFDALPFRLDDYAGLGTYRGKEIADFDRIIEQIDSGRMIQTGGNTISFGFLDKNHTIGVYNNPR